MITFSNIVDRFEKFVDKHFFLKTFSFGSPEDLDLEKFEQYPLLHLVYTTGSYVDKVKSYSLEVYILDCPRGEENRKEFEKDVVTQSEMCAEDILADLETGGSIFDFDFAYILESASVTPLEEKGSNVLSGCVLNISIGVPYLYDSCNAPLTGTSPQGTSTTYTSRGLLRVKTTDGVPDVTTVKTIVVGNDTLTDDGNGVVSIKTTDNGKISKIEYTNAGNEEYYQNTTGTFKSQVIGVAPYTDITYTKRVLNNVQYITNFALFRREFHGLSSGTTVRIQYSLDVTYEAAGLIAITSVSTEPSLSATLLPTSSGSETVSLDGTFTSLTATYVFANLTVLSNMNCTVRVASFKATVTNPS